ncbi:basic amino acid/polyamine antiporter [Haemophilus paraphrohaemolyticus]|uniref:Transporter, basic amino acid/polyamine antiporter (APA) family n=1 Tax=Haemophilus paraphrohaemolyticus HK411 TaxID=1095743 RepID=I2NFN7_9PAST|nr:basic amino acid/polyamine antiporter [Haemophilus paraphrohaemolyticus]EIG24648.1 transporter, basic amino acid/polyamine antiporter (APA) family [Haemophilus paraphrohaemolyticus HK411]OOR93815.1 arginine:ornithine antiporter [Haemophilus paraphrohaemolyticus]STP01991.1 Putative arginine/ornithine antiporter [Haemophilus paraphrohaemolyticus]
MSKDKIGLVSLTALVLSSMIGSGIFSLPQNMAAVASAEALLAGWAITGFGIIFLGLSFFFLSRLRPDLDGGIYTYAREGFGDFIGGLAAWGYWLCTSIGSVSYLVVAFSGFGLFFDSEQFTIFGDGTSLVSILSASLVVWLIHILIAKGIKEAAYVNLIATIVKVLPLIIFIVLAIIFFSSTQFMQDFHGESLQMPLLDQIKSTMLITLWVFVGVEGATVLSAHAKKKNDVGIATILGILIALILYVAITALSLGILPREVIAAMPNPSMTGIMEHMIGTSGKILITFCLIVSVLASYMSWTMFSAEVMYQASQTQVFPRFLNKKNENDTPISSLWFTNIVIQIILVLVFFTSKGYDVLIQLATTMILVPYFLVGTYLLRLAFNIGAAWYIKLAGIIATLYGFWLVYAAGIEYLLFSVILYTPGAILFFYTRYQKSGKFDFSRNETVALGCTFILSIGSIYAFL